MSIDREIDALCDVFEQAWQTPGALSIEDVLPKIDEARRPRLLTELVKIEVDLLELTDLSAKRAEYHARFPQYRQDVDRALREIATRDQREAPQPPAAEPPLEPGDSVAKYELEQLLGMGSFGAVYLAKDPEIGRQVAIKVPIAGTSIGKDEANKFLKDAQLASELKHPGIVTIYEVGWSGKMPYIVQEFVAGGDLKATLQQKRHSFREAARLILEIAEALEAAHEQGIFHRDVKPGNILLTKDGKPCITDFGLAMRGQLRHQHVDEVAGAPAYMAPEQARGETHRIDARTDIWGVGVIFYHILCGVVPFVAKKQQELARLIKEEDPLAPRTHVAEIPAELERICLKCLSKRMMDRYPHAANLIDDLRRWLNDGTQFKNNGATENIVTVRPKGLRPFDQDDEDYFLHLLPGPRDAHGIPDSVRFWVGKISQLESEGTFPVGLLYGPSGSGKTSFVRAGILPRLPSNVTVIFVESTGDETELRILKQIRGLFPGLPTELDLPETFALLRDEKWIAEDEKILIVLDQFEQWLHANRTIEDAQLVEGLRQCDGGRIQALVTVRDDFWMGISRFMQALEMDLVQRGNADIVDRFSLRHARKVLQMFGAAFGQGIPESEEEKDDYEEFLEAAVLELGADDRVVCLHVALFAEMLKNKPWRMSTLQSGGGAAGIGVAFLEGAFDSDRGNPSHRVHARAARLVLELLLPDEGTEIKGHMRSLDDLRGASGYANDERSFTRLLAILDQQLRLITPTDPVLGSSDDSSVGKSSDDKSRAMDSMGYYQLTHDFLVPALRNWIYRREQSTWRGRTRLRMQERASLWSSRRESRQLPSFGEWVGMLVATRARDRTAIQNAMLSKAAVLHLRRAGVLTLIVIAVIASMLNYQANLRMKQAEGLTVQIINAPAQQLQIEIDAARPYADEVWQILQDRERLEGLLPPETLESILTTNNIKHAEAALGVADSDWLQENVRTAPLEQLPNFAASLRGQEDLIRRDWRVDCAGESDAVRLRLALLLFFMGDESAFRQIVKEPEEIDLYTRFVIEGAAAISNYDALILAWEKLQRTPDPDKFLVSGLCQFTASVGPSKLPVPARSQIEKQLLNFYSNSPHGIVHSAAAYALYKWRIPLPPLPADNQLRPGFDWFVNTYGQTMIKLPKHGGYLAATETTVRQFRTYLLLERLAQPNAGAQADITSEPQSRAQWSPYLDCPIQDISAADIMRYCNALSDYNKRTRCYFENEDGTWSLDSQADGYRLLTPNEWTRFCRAGTKTAYPFGSTPDHADEFLFHGDSTYARVATHRPNRWGYFDFLGNVGELSVEIGDAGELKFFMSGNPASFATNISHHVPEERVLFSTEATIRMNIIGFRVYCPFPPKDQQAKDGQ